MDFDCLTLVHISTFDYLLRVCNAIGINPEIAFQYFIFKVFDVGGDFLEDKVIKAVAASLDAKNIKLSNSSTNYDVIKSSVPQYFLTSVKLKIAKQ